MRKLLFILLLAANSTLLCLSQDVIYKKDGSEIKAKIIEIEVENVKYKIHEQLDGPVRNIAKKDVFLIIYQDGTKEKFTDTSTINPNQDLSNNNAISGINNQINQSNTNQSIQSKADLDYVTRKLEQMKSLKQGTLIGFCVGLCMFPAALFSDDLSSVYLGIGSALVIITVPLHIYAGYRIDYFEKRKWDLTLNLIQYPDFYQIRPNYASSMTVGLRISF